MNFLQFQNRLYSTLSGSQVKNQAVYYGSTIIETEDHVYINGIETDLTNLEEAKHYVKTQLVQETITSQITLELYEELSPNIIADIITKHHDVRVTDTLIESYIDLASSKLFTVDPVVKDIKTFNKLDTVLENHYDFVLEDGSKILVNGKVLQHINNIFSNHTDIIEYMRESKENFLSVLSQMKEE